MIRLIPQPAIIIEKEGFCDVKTQAVYKKTPEVTGEGSYTVNITEDKITVRASTDCGLFYGKMTVRQLSLLYPEGIHCCEIKDSPLYAYRGFMIDSVRHIQTEDELKKMIELASMLKLNKFHWHISDDHGFRVELDTIPELTEYASVRDGDNFGSHCSSNEKYGGYYTKQEIRDIIAFCGERFIDVIPEIDMPGHTSAILHVFPELSCKKQPVEIKQRQGIYKENLCIGNPATTEFVHKLLDELCELFPCEYFHIGGDEAPNDNRKGCKLCEKALKEYNVNDFSALQCRFADSVAEYLKTKGKKAIVWNDLLKGGDVDRCITVQKWLDLKNRSFDAANAGNPVIVSDFMPYYADYPYGMHTYKSLYHNNPRGSRTLTSEGRKNIIGVEIPIWTEYIDTPERLEYLCLPRWFAAAENGWTADYLKNYREFMYASEKLGNYLSAHGYTLAPKNTYRIKMSARPKDVLDWFLRTLPDKTKR